MNNDEKKSILLVEDQAIIAMLTKSDLEKYGYTVYHVNTGEKAVHFIINSTYPVELILMDIDLGSGIDGTQAAEQILQFKDIPVVFLSSHTEPEIVEKTEKITSYGYVVKNSTITVLDASIKMAFKLFNSQTKNKQADDIVSNIQLGLHIYHLENIDDDRTLRMVFSNKASEQMIGLRADEINNKTLDEIFPNLREMNVPQRYADVVRSKQLKDFEDINYSDTRIMLACYSVKAFPLPNNHVCVAFEDNTEKKKTTGHIEQLALIADSAPSAIIVCDYEGRFLFINEKTYHIFGYTKNELMSLTLHNIDAPVSEALITARMKELQDKGEAEFEITHIRKDGSLFPSQVLAKKIEWYGKPAILSFFTDDTERVQKEEQKTKILSIQQNLNSLMIEQSTDHTYDQAVTTILAQLDALFHPIASFFSEYDKEASTLKLKEIKARNGVLDSALKAGGKTLLSNVAPVNAEMFREMMQVRVKKFLNLSEATGGAVSKSLSQILEKTLKISCCLGLSFTSESDVFGTITLLLDREADTGMIELLKNFAHFTSITLKRIVTEQNLRDSDYHLSAIGNNLPNAQIYQIHIAADSKPVFTYVSENVRNMHECTPAEVINDASLLFNRVHQDDRYANQQAMEKAIRETTKYDQELRIVRKSGEIRWHRMISQPRKAKDGSILFDGFDMDITDRKHAEEQLQKQLSEKNTLLQEVHHRVKNNIANIESLLLLQADSTANPEVKTALQDAISRVESMRILYEKLLISKDYQDVSIKNYIENLIDSLLAIFTLKENIIIEKNITDFDIASTKAIPVGIIINELLTNVFKYAFKDRDNGKVSITITKKENSITLIIQDNGVGMNEKREPKLSSHLGLTLVTMIVEQLDGTYSMVNENGIKSIICFEL